MARSSPQTERIVMLMQLLTDQPTTARSLADIARHLGVSKPTCYPMVIALTEAGWLLRDPVSKGYRLGPAVVPIGDAASRAMAPVEVARPLMRDLADDSDMAAIAFVPTGADLAIGEIVQPVTGRRGTLGLRLGDTLEIAPPLGAGLAAWYSPDRLDEWLLLGADHVGVDHAELRELYRPMLEVIRARGYAVECADQREQSLSATVAGLRGMGVAGQRAVTALREAQRRLPTDVVVGEIDADTEYRPISVNAVAFAPGGVPAVILAIVDARTSLSGREVIGLGEKVRAAADAVTEGLGGTPPVQP
ncbi:helix-turn-helix domain-containing protein [Gordonia sp. HS-NH1]|uniref:helix-turn-helix domain-containing protein n=1 Tax=Gordonia sp. HS-NH1 TaxID=1435068 RepID=UPI0006E13ABE|nr:helix-turn-helix domain-containing protein [Gordonia sp. HS-NH1]